MSSPLLEVEDLHVTYGGTVRALRGVNLTVPEASVVTVLGSNGAGKTTLVRALVRALEGEGGRQTGGVVRFDGDDLSRRTTAAIVRRGMVLVPEGRQVFRDLTVRENLLAGGSSLRRPSERTAAISRVLEVFPDLADRTEMRAGLLSGGQQQMLAIGRALMVRPRLLLLDEPSLGLAPRLVDQIGEIVTRLNGEGTAVLLIEQNAAMGLRVAETAYVLTLGQVTESGPAAELAAGDAVKERYLGHSAAGATPAGTAVAAERPTPPAEPAADAGATPPAGPPELRVEDVTVAFRGIKALSEVSMSIEPGSVHALIGPNGAGKSTCINVLSGVYTPTSGRVLLGADDITGAAPHRIAARGVARTFQNLAISRDLTVREALLLGRHRLMRHGIYADALRLPRARQEEHEHAEVAEEIAELVGLTDALDQRVGGLPYGHLKRLDIGRAVAARPAVLLLDEPVAGMAHGESSEVADVVRSVRERLGLSVLIVEHDMPFVMGLAERVTVLDFGEVITEGTPDEVRDHPDVIRAYLGTDAA
jgi:ABC-type branched-subunit amino acid transport system ATPase component